MRRTLCDGRLLVAALMFWGLGQVRAVAQSTVCKSKSSVSNWSNSEGWPGSFSARFAHGTIPPTGPITMFWSCDASSPSTASDSFSGTFSYAVTNNGATSHATMCSASIEASGQNDYPADGGCSSDISFLGSTAADMVTGPGSYDVFGGITSQSTIILPPGGSMSFDGNCKGSAGHVVSQPVVPVDPGPGSPP